MSLFDNIVEVLQEFKNDIILSLKNEIINLKQEIVNLNKEKDEEINNLKQELLRTREELEQSENEKNNYKNKLIELEKENNTSMLNSRFVKTINISDELACFLEITPDTKITRNEVINKIHQYIRINNLQDKNNRRKILLDEKLTNLLRITENEELNYFNLQKYLSSHFIKTTEKKYIKCAK
jgi:chromatin remodeling complex protein RSC6